CAQHVAPGTTLACASARMSSSANARNAAPASSTIAIPEQPHDLHHSRPALPVAVRVDPFHLEPVREQDAYHCVDRLPHLDCNTYLPAASHAVAGDGHRGELSLLQEAARCPPWPKPDGRSTARVGLREGLTGVTNCWFISRPSR